MDGLGSTEASGRQRAGWSMSRHVVIVDEGVGRETPLWRQFVLAMGERELDYPTMR